jgi:hypothetical protein
MVQLQVIWIENPSVEVVVSESGAPEKCDLPGVITWPVNTNCPSVDVLVNPYELWCSTDGVVRSTLEQHIPHYFERLHIELKWFCTPSSFTPFVEQLKEAAFRFFPHISAECD